ncbi:FAD:protein FMN transferase [Kitasatospora viridis]|uniref:FAD:protein FMN transferase n=1 Tax=Kitasatospora viridis TaxID=281105 RepID=A0A561S976_9ACTN|nr:FAD:protein FMN transferase [Kitasatospora viridis]TWF71428.1 thiamine biosynthesis lipoprotein [Kitasatospora viridis]
MTGQARFEVFGTTAHLVVTEPDRLVRALRLLRAELAAIDAACSRFRPDSELSRANASPGTVIRVGPLLAEALEVAWRAAESSGGLVDPTVGTAVRGLGYDRSFHDHNFHERSFHERSFAALRPEQLGPPVTAPAPGHHRVDWDPQTRLLRLPAGTTLDLGATAKAWAADRTARLLAEAVGCGVLVNLGGDLAVAGEVPAGGWRIALAEDHRAAPPDAPVIAIRGGGLATSGTTVRTWRRAGRQLHHIVDPRTGGNPPGCWRTVSVAAASCADANTAATAAIVAGPGAPAMLRHLNLPARLTALDGTVTRLGGWPQDSPTQRGAA